MAGLIDVGILKPELAGSFAAGYRGAEEQRNALAQRQQQAAQAEQQLASGRQRLQMDEMTMQRMQEDRAALTGLQAKLRAAGQSDDPKVFFKALTESNDPNIIMKGIEGLQRYQALEAYDRQYGGGGAPAMPSSAPNAMVAPSTPAPRVERGVDAYGKPFEAEVGGGIAPRGAMGQPLAPLGAAAPEPANALAPAAPAPVNAMAPSSAMPNIDALRRQYGMAVAAGRSDAPVLLKQIEAALRGEQNRPVVVGNRLVSPTGQELYAAPERTDTDLIRNFNAAKAQGFKGNLFGYQREIAMASRPPAPPAQPVAPTITQIVDPANPNQMITIDARRYQGGSVGSPGVFGVGGKEPAAAVRENKAEAGKSQLADDLENLRASFLVLDQKRAIPSTERNPLSNIASATAATGVGQAAGRFLGTEAQVEREVINSARTRLVNSIKNATGMSAQQLNSNVELQTMLRSISDPGQPIQAALRIIEDIENAYVKGAGMPKKNAPARSLTPQDQEALNWANSNPNDPRAAQIKQRLGAK